MELRPPNQSSKVVAAMAHTAKAVANDFLSRASREGRELSPMKLQKLVFFAHGWHLAVCKVPLIDEQVECWKYGPVIRSLFGEFKEFGSDAITRLATIDVFKRSPTGGLQWTSSTPDMESADSHTTRILDYTWDGYKGFSAIKLSNMTHLPGTPWSQVMAEHNGSPPKGTDIPAELIATYFKSELEAM